MLAFFEVRLRLGSVILIQIVNLPLEAIFTDCGRLDVFLTFFFLLLQLVMMFIKLSIHFSSKIRSSLPVTNLPVEFYAFCQAVLNIELEAWNDSRNVVPLLLLKLEGLIAESVLDFLLFPGFYELLQALPLVHHICLFYEKFR